MTGRRANVPSDKSARPAAAPEIGTPTEVDVGLHVLSFFGETGIYMLVWGLLERMVTSDASGAVIERAAPALYGIGVALPQVAATVVGCRFVLGIPYYGCLANTRERVSWWLRWRFTCLAALLFLYSALLVSPPGFAWLGLVIFFHVLGGVGAVMHVYSVISGYPSD